MRKNDTISEELISLHAFSLAAKRPAPYAVPNGYFGALAQDTLNSIQLLDAADPALPYSKEHLYTIPESYFENLPDTVLQSARAADAIIALGQVPWERNLATPYQVPQGYFEQLATGILAFVADTDIDANAEITALSPVLAGLKDQAALSVPAGYFRNKVSIPEAIGSADATDLPAAASARRKWWRPAVAAAILILFAFTGWQYFSPQSHKVNSPMYASDINAKYEKQLAQISDANIQQYIENNLDEFDEDMLSNALAAAPVSGDATNDIFNGISNSDIEAYLNNM